MSPEFLPNYYVVHISSSNTYFCDFLWSVEPGVGFVSWELFWFWVGSQEQVLGQLDSTDVGQKPLWNRLVCPEVCPRAVFSIGDTKETNRISGFEKRRQKIFWTVAAMTNYLPSAKTWEEEKWTRCRIFVATQSCCSVGGWVRWSCVCAGGGCWGRRWTRRFVWSCPKVSEGRACRKGD